MSQPPDVVTVARALYMAGAWRSDDLDETEARGLWAELRDALGLPAGTATRLGAAPGVATEPERATLRIPEAEAADVARVREVLDRIYRAGRWEGRQGEARERELWERVRDSLGLAPGTATALGVGARPRTADR